MVRRREVVAYGNAERQNGGGYRLDYGRIYGTRDSHSSVGSHSFMKRCRQTEPVARPVVCRRRICYRVLHAASTAHARTHARTHTQLVFDHIIGYTLIHY